MMRELRGASGMVGIVTVLTLLASAGPSLAAPGEADLVVRGVATDGTTAFVSDGGWLLWSDPGQERYEDVTLTVPSAAARVIVHRVSEWCFAENGLRTASVGLPALLDRRSALDDVAGTVEQLVADPLGTVRDVALATRAASVLPLEETLAKVPLARHSTAAAPLPFLPAPVPTPCMADPSPRDTTETMDLTNLVLTVQGSSEFYTLIWQAGGQDSSGNAILQTDASELFVQREEEHLRLLGAEDRWRDYDLSSARTVPEGVVRAEAADGRGSLFGDGTLWVYNAVAQVSGAEGSKTWETGRFSDTDQFGQSREVVQYLEVQLSGATAGSFASPGKVAFYGETLNANVDGVLHLKEARGTVRSGDGSRELRGEAYELTGTFGAAFRRADSDREAQRGFLALRTNGDLAPLSAGAVEAGPGPVTTTAAVSVAALAAGALAYFWPALKWMLAPLYTRIPTDALLMHDAREKIYKLIKQEPGIHAHEIAARLDLGWGTAVYHLKLLERNGLVVARHEGRYKRFFVTGDQRLQRKEAVSLLRNATSRSIASQVATHPGLIQKQVCEALGLSPSLASWHLQRLEAAQVVRAERLGRAVRYIPGPAWTELQELDALHALPPTTVAAPGAA